MRNCIFVCEKEGNVRNVYGESAPDRVYTKKDIVSSENDFSEVEYIFSTWGMPEFSENEIRENLPGLKAVFYGAGSVRWFAKEFFDCGVRVFSAWKANAVPVAEFTLAQILLAAKGYFKVSSAQSAGDLPAADNLKFKYPGNYGISVGIIGAGMIGRKVMELLKPFDIKVCAYDAFLSKDELAELGAEKLSLDELFERCLVVSNHLADNAETAGMINYELLSKLMKNASFINTGRGAQVVTADLIRILREREDITALLDVTYPEPLPEGHEFFEIKNCFLTPHIAGSMGLEVRRMAEYMHEAYRKTLAGEKSDCEVTLEMLKTMA